MEEIYRQKILGAFPKEIAKDVKEVINFLSARKFEIHAEVYQDIILENEKLTIPGRLYFDDVTESEEKSLSEFQCVILNCLYLSNHDGYIRERRLRKLENRTEYFLMPYVFQVLGEYVIEILEVVEKQINQKTINNYQRFIQENPRYWQKTQRRIVSYWNEYYRKKYPKLKDFVGMIIIKKINKSVA